MTNQDIIYEIQKLESGYGAYKSKALRNYRLFTYSSTVTLDLSDSEVVGFFQRGTFDIEDDTTSSIQENIIASCIETLCSKIASQKVRPFFNTINGTFKEMQIARQAQIFFDQLYDENNVNNVITNAFRSACIFDKGIVKIASDGISCRLPWNVYVDPKEATYKNITHIAERLPKFPGRLLKSVYGIDKDVNPRSDYTVYEYYDTIEHIKAVYVLELNKVIKQKWDAKIVPYLFLYYSDPIKGNTSQSVVDQLYGIQMQIDELLAVIKDSITLNPGMTMFVPRSSNIKTNMLSNRTGQIVQYDPVPGMTSTPVTYATSDIVSPQFVQLLDKLKNDAYEIVGISQLSATSQKPSGLNSGVALSTMEDIESDRFETQLNNVIRMYVDIAKACLDIFPPEDNILPNDINRANITWADIIDARNNLKIQFSAASALSKDPSEKLKQLTSLAEAGVIPQSHIATLMELPDLQSGYNIGNNAFNAVYTFIDNVIANSVVPDEIPEYLPTDKGGLLETEIVNTILSLAVKPKENAIEKDILKQLMSKLQEVQLNSATNAEMFAVQQLNAELTQAMPQIQQQAQEAVQQTQDAIDNGTFGTEALQ
jgi:gas vesicle protein